MRGDKYSSQRWVSKQDAADSPELLHQEDPKPNIDMAKFKFSSSAADNVLDKIVQSASVRLVTSYINDDEKEPVRSFGDEVEESQAQKIEDGFGFHETIREDSVRDHVAKRRKLYCDYREHTAMNAWL